MDSNWSSVRVRVLGVCRGTEMCNDVSDVCYSHRALRRDRGTWASIWGPVPKRDRGPPPRLCTLGSDGVHWSAKAQASCPCELRPQRSFLGPLALYFAHSDAVSLDSHSVDDGQVCVCAISTCSRESAPRRDELVSLSASPSMYPARSHPHPIRSIPSIDLCAHAPAAPWTPI